MLTWLLTGTVLYLVTAYLPAFMLLATIGPARYAGSRDDEPAASALRGRAVRAARNFTENYAVFMGLGILSLVVPEADTGLAATGAAAFVLARVIYLPLYLGAVPYVRSLVFAVGWAGMIAMGAALV